MHPTRIAVRNMKAIEQVAAGVATLPDLVARLERIETKLDQLLAPPTPAPAPATPPAPPAHPAKKDRHHG